jgi:predicted SnoaL-like aldol condensation-catalyzing enzyme
MRHAALIATVLCIGLVAVKTISTADATPPEPIARGDQAKLLESADPQLAANKKLAYTMYRVLLQAGQWKRAKDFIADDYIQHNPNVVNGRAALEEFIKGSRPELPVEETLKLPLISIVAERDRVVLSFVRQLKDDKGETYYTSWFDMFRIENGKIAEHWDPATITPDALKFNPNTNSSNK